MTKAFDLVVIGTGAAASTAAYRCRSEGWDVAVIDSRPFGGTCPLRGWDPKKVLVGAAEIVDWVHRMKGKGVTSDVRIDWVDLMRFKNTFTEPFSAQMERGFAKAGIETFNGRARFVDCTSVAVQDDTLVGRYVLVAAGAQPARLDIPGEEYLTTSDQFLELEALPPRIVFMGAGYISFEFAHIAARAGAKVSILQRGAQPLKGFDPDLVRQLVEATRGIGVDVELNTPVRAIERHSGHLAVQASTQTGERIFEADLVVHGAGRLPEIEALDLKNAGVEHQEQGLVVNTYLQSVSNPAVYAAGDCAATPGLPLTPVASMEGRVAAANMLEGNKAIADYTAVPSVVFTIPPLAAVGLSEAGARERQRDFRANTGDTSGWYSSRRVGLKHSRYKVLVEEDTDRIIGAHLLGMHAEEVINLFAVAIKSGLRASDLKDVRYTYPSHSDDINYML